MKYLQMLVNISNLERSPHFILKYHPRACWVIWIILQLQNTTMENNRIHKIDRIYCIDQYEDNLYDKYN